MDPCTHSNLIRGSAPKDVISSKDSHTPFVFYTHGHGKQAGAVSTPKEGTEICEVAEGGGRSGRAGEGYRVGELLPPAQMSEMQGQGSVALLFATEGDVRNSQFWLSWLRYASCI